MNPRVSFFSRINAQGKPAPVLTLLEQIRGGKWSNLIEKVRNAVDRDTANQLKKGLAGFTASCVTNGARKAVDALSHSGLLQGDVDDIGMEAAETLREALRADPHVFAAWISPSGNGLKILIRIPSDLGTHASAFLTAERYFFERFNVKLDPSCKDVARLCFVSHDPCLWWNEEAEVLPMDSPAEPMGRRYTLREAGVSPPDYSSTSATDTTPDSDTDTITNTTQQPPHRFPSPDVAKLYHTLVRCRIGTVHAGTRNAHLVELLPFLFSAVGEQVALSFASEFHREHEAVFNDPIACTLAESKSLWRGVGESYLTALPPETRTAYAALPDVERSAFRVCRALAALEIETLPLGQFFLSSANLGARLGIVSMSAYRILSGFVGAGILSIVTKGTRREKGKQGIAATYRFLLPWQ